MTRKPFISVCSIAGWLSLAISLFVLPTMVSAQTRFLPPQKRQDFKDYDFVEKCLLAAELIKDEKNIKAGTFRDTVEFESTELVSLVPDSSVQFAKGCSARWTLPAPQLEMDTVFYPLAKLLLRANRDDEVAASLQQRVALRANAPDSVIPLSWGNDFGLFAFERPVRFNLFDVLLEEINARSAKDTTNHRLTLWYAQSWWQLLKWYRGGGKTDRATDAANHLVALNARLSDDTKEQTAWNAKQGPLFVFTALDYLNYSALLDSLAKSTAAYVQLHESLISQATGRRAALLRSPVGKRAEPLHYDFYFKNPANPNGPNVSEGIGHRTTLVVFLGHDCYFPRHSQIPKWRAYGKGSMCYDVYAMLRRLRQEFPDVPFVIGSQTRGFFGKANPPPPAKEAEQLKALWLDYHRLPADLAVENTEHWFLDGYDKRRIDNKTENFFRYSFDQTVQFQEKVLYLLDSEGRVIKSKPFLRSEESSWRDMLRVLSTRQTASRQ